MICSGWGLQDALILRPPLGTCFIRNVEFCALNLLTLQVHRVRFDLKKDCFCVELIDFWYNINKISSFHDAGFPPSPQVKPWDIIPNFRIP